MLLVYVLCFNSNQLNSVASCHQLFSATPSNSSKLITWLRCAVYQEIQTVFVLQFGSLEYGITCCNKQNIQVLWSQCDILNNKVNKRDWFNSLFYDGIDTTHVNTFKNTFTGILRTQIPLTLHKIVTFLLWSSSKWLWLNYLYVAEQCFTKYTLKYHLHQKSKSHLSCYSQQAENKIIWWRHITAINLGGFILFSFI